MRYLVSGGGTAGHISPILATVDALRSLDNEAEILYVGQHGGMEAKIAGAAGFEFAAITAGKYRRFHNVSLRHKTLNLSRHALNIRDLTRTLRGVAQAARVIKDFQPQVVFIKGGYVGLPVGLAAGLLRVPYVVHESDTVPGLTNRILAKRAEAVAVGFPAEKYQNFPPDKIVYTGNPIRQELLTAHRLEGLAKFGLDPKLPAVLIVGGSQGARKVNEAVVEALPELTAVTQVIHVAGERDIEQVRFETKRLDLKYPERYQAHAFLQSEMGMALAAADVVISRAGANSIAELAALAKPAILVPNPHLTGGHQLHNAQVLARAGAVKVIQESRLRPETIASEVKKIIYDEQEQRYLSKSIAEFAVPDADRRLAELIYTAAKEEITE